MISVIVCTKNRFHDLAECLQALKEQDYNDFEVIVVDGAGEFMVQKLVKSFGYEYVNQAHEASKMNTPSARNLGIKKARGDIVAFVDDDAVPTRAWLANLVRHYIGGNPAGVGGLAEASILSTRREKDVYGVGLVHATFLALLGEDTSSCGRVLPSGLVTENWAQITRDTSEVESLIGANMSFSKLWLQKVGPFDESISTFGIRDETDICLRIVERGGTILYDPEAVVNHKLSPKKTSAIRMYHKYYTDFYFLMKHRQFFSFPKFLIRETLELTYLVGRSVHDMKSQRGWRNALRGRIDAYLRFGICHRTGLHQALFDSKSRNHAHSETTSRYNP